ncbi:MAG: hypothetical protein ACMXX7_01430 [Candidatus Woesearchaeota archaeon]
MVFKENQIEQLRKGLKNAFSSIKIEFNEHLETINQNTTEIQSLYDYVSEVEHKLDKLSERIDELQMHLNPTMAYDQFSVELTHREQEVFVVLYAESQKITAKTIARRLGFTDEMVQRYIYSLISKGIPVLKHFQDEEMFITLDDKFKELQARRNVLKIDESISRQLLTEKII